MQADEQLVRKIRRYSDKKAADELFERYYREVYAYVYRQCGQRELAMDLTQEIFLTVYRGIQTYEEGKAKFRTWLYRIAANKVTGYYRSRQHRQSLRDVPETEGLEELPDDSDLLRDLITKENVMNIMEIVMQYDPAGIEIFRKKCFEEMTFAQIAQELSLSESTVKTRFYRMIKRLQQDLSVNGFQE